MDNKINIINWLKRYFNLPYTTDAFEKVNNSLDFLWVWSVFEAKFLDHNDGAKKFGDQMIDLGEKYSTKFSELDDTFKFFFDRYFINGQVTDNFNRLGLRSKVRARVESILKASSPTNKDKLQFLFIVIYKFRCNLFHGSKDPLLWKDFDPVFYQINLFLIRFLDTYKN